MTGFSSTAFAGNFTHGPAFGGGFKAFMTGFAGLFAGPQVLREVQRFTQTGFSYPHVGPFRLDTTGVNFLDPAQIRGWVEGLTRDVNVFVGNIIEQAERSQAAANRAQYAGADPAYAYASSAGGARGHRYSAAGPGFVPLFNMGMGGMGMGGMGMGGMGMWGGGMGPGGMGGPGAMPFMPFMPFGMAATDEPRARPSARPGAESYTGPRTDFRKTDRGPETSTGPVKVQVLDPQEADAGDGEVVYREIVDSDSGDHVMRASTTDRKSADDDIIDAEIVEEAPAPGKMLELTAGS